MGRNSSEVSPGGGRHSRSLSRPPRHSVSHGRSKLAVQYRSRSRSHSRGRRSYSRSRSRGRSYSTGYRGRNGRFANGQDAQPNRCLGVFGLSIHTTERQIKDIFSKYGRLEKVQVILDAKTGRSRGFCFVYFDNEEDAKDAKENCAGMKIDGRSIRVDFSITQRAHTPTPGIYMGNPSNSRDRGYGNRRRYEEDDYDRGYSRRSPSPYAYRPRKRYYGRSRSRSYSSHN